MKKLFSLIKASMTEGMNLFKVSTKKSNVFTKVLLPIFLACIIMFYLGSYSSMFMETLTQIHMEYVLLSLFILCSSILTIVEGIYKSGSLLFNCKDDNLLLSLPLKRNTVLFIRIFKFYVFELLYNSLFLLPAIIVYAWYVNPVFSYYLLSVLGLLLFPILPIFISCILGTITSFLSSRFKGKNLAQTIITIIMLIGVFYISYNLNGLIENIAENAASINDIITKLYYPAGTFIKLITNFKFITLLLFIIIHVALLVISILIIGKVFFSINSKIKGVKVGNKHKEYHIKSSSQVKALIKKELNRFFNSTVFVINAGFGLVLFVIVCIVIVIKNNSLMELLMENNINLSIDINNYMPLVLFGLICISSFMTSITSSMISLEGKSFSILKSLPVKPFTVAISKVLTAVLIMFPCIVIGDLILFITYKMNIISILLLLITSFVLPLLSELIGILVNLKYPRMDAKNDTEVVKQSMSSMISVFAGMGLAGLTGYLIYKSLSLNISINMTILMFLFVYSVISSILLWILYKTCDKNFNNIVA